MITKRFGAEFIDEDVYYPIEVSLIQKGLTLSEAKELANDLQAQIEIAEWKDAQAKTQASIVTE